MRAFSREIELRCTRVEFTPCKDGPACICAAHNSMEDTDDLSKGEALSEPLILERLKTRHAADVIFTAIGQRVLLTCNPFTPVAQCGFAECDRYATAESAALAQLPPHAFKTARACYEVLRSTGAPQAVLISGESGAGKTETARLCLQCLTLSSGSGGSVVQALLECSVLMESLGNARTLHNDNSSRFGKWLALTFGRAGTISGARAQCFLLEQSRVAALQPGERNFHAIHALVAGASDAERAEWGLPPPADAASAFRFLRPRVSAATAAAPPPPPPPPPHSPPPTPLPRVGARAPAWSAGSTA